MPFRPLAALVLVLCALAVAPGARAQSTVSLLPGWQDADGRRWAGVRIALEPGWKTYWRAPLGGGIPPRFDWSGSTNVAGLRVHWPVPMVFETYGVRSIGYLDDVVFPVEIVPGDPGRPVTLDLALSYGVCEAVCIPAEDRLTAAFAPGASGAARAVAEALAARPMTAVQAGYTGAACEIAPQGDAFRLQARLAHGGAPEVPRLAVVESGSDAVWIDVDRIEGLPGAHLLGARVEHYGDGPLALDRTGLRMTLFGDGLPVEVIGCTG